MTEEANVTTEDQTSSTEAVDDASALKSALQKEREARKALEKQAKAYQGLGLTPDEIAEMKTAREKAEEDKARQAGEWDKLREKLSEQHKTELQKTMERLAAVEASEHEARVESGLKSALMEAGVTEEGATLLPDILKNRAKIEDDNGKRVVKVFDADGSPMIAKNGRDASFADLVAQAAEKYPSLFKATTKLGSGTPPGGNRAGSTTQRTVTRSQFDTMSHSDRASFSREGGKVVDG